MIDPRHEILFERVRIGPKTAPNRFYQVPHASGFGTHQPSEDTLHREFAADRDRLAAAGISAIHLIGDAVAPRMPSEAVFDGHRLPGRSRRPIPTSPEAAAGASRALARPLIFLTAVIRDEGPDLQGP